MLTWVVGGSGLLGSAVRRAASRRGSAVHAGQVAWHDPERAVVQLLEQASTLPTSGWRLIWCAGAGVAGSDAAQFERERTVVRTFLERWDPPPADSCGIFLTSSAGAIYAGSSPRPFTEEVEANPLSTYGETKLAIEADFRDFAVSANVPLLIGRISNLYGPGQNLAKGQGLVSLLCRAYLTGKPLDIYVPLDTIRDYLYADDAAMMALAGTDAVAEAGGQHLKIMANGTPMSIAGVLGQICAVGRRKPPILSAPSAMTGLQNRDLCFRSVAWPPLGGYVRTPFSVGVAACLASVAQSLRRAST